MFLLIYLIIIYLIVGLFTVVVDDAIFGQVMTLTALQYIFDFLFWPVYWAVYAYGTIKYPNR